MVKTEYRLQVLQQIAANSCYICYGLKAGHIRVLNKHTATRTLFKRHASMVVDMKFFSSGSNLLASADMGGEVHVCKVYADSPEGPILDELLVKHSFSLAPGGGSASKRLCWHPSYENVLAVASAQCVSFINVPPSAGVASAPEFSTPSAPPSTSTEGAITSLAFSDRGDLLAVSDDKGYIYAWAISPDLLSAASVAALPAEPDLRFSARLADPQDYVSSVEFLPSASSSSSGGVLVAGNHNNSTLQLWVVDAEAPPQCTYTLQLVSSSTGPAAFFNHLLVQPSMGCVVLANTLRQQVYVVHVQQQQVEGGVVSERCGGPCFDYLADFSVKQPILSMTTTSESSYDDEQVEVAHLYCVQTEAVQQYMLYFDQCLPPAVAQVAAAPAAAAVATPAVAYGVDGGALARGGRADDHHAAAPVAQAVAVRADPSSSAPPTLPRVLPPSSSSSAHHTIILQQQQLGAASLPGHQLGGGSLPVNIMQQQAGGGGGGGVRSKPWGLGV